MGRVSCSVVSGHSLIELFLDQEQQIGRDELLLVRVVRWDVEGRKRRARHGRRGRAGARPYRLELSTSSLPVD